MKFTVINFLIISSLSHPYQLFQNIIATLTPVAVKQNFLGI